MILMVILNKRIGSIGKSTIEMNSNLFDKKLDTYACKIFKYNYFGVTAHVIVSVMFSTGVGIPAPVHPVRQQRRHRVRVPVLQHAGLAGLPVGERGPGVH